MTINTYLSPEFEMACDLLYLKPQEVIEAFIANVSLPYFCSTDQYLAEKVDVPNRPLLDCTFSPDRDKTKCSANPVKILATNFLLTYCSLFNERFLPVQKVQEKYIKRFKRLLPQLRKEENAELRYYNLVRFYLDWQKEVISNMSEKDAVIDVQERKKHLRFK